MAAETVDIQKPAVRTEEPVAVDEEAFLAFGST